MDAEQKRFFVLIAITAAVIVSLVVGILYLVNRDTDEERIPSNVILTPDEQDRAEKTSLDFLQVNSNWGLKENSLTPENTLHARYVIGANTPEIDNFWFSRVQAYKIARDTFIMNESRLWYSDSSLVSWLDTTARDTMSNFKLINSSTNPVEKGFEMTVDGVTRKAVDMDVKYKVRQTRYVQPINDTSWDGSFDVFEKTFEDTITITLVDFDGTWMVYDAKGHRFQFLLSFWPNSSQGFEEHQFDFEKVDIWKADTE